MAYITAEYYNNTFMGASAADDTELAVLILRASDLVDVLTRYAIVDAGFSTLPEFAQNQIEKAVAYQVEYLIQNAGLDTANSGSGVLSGGFSVGKFSVAQGNSGNESSGTRDTRVSPMCISCLEPTGLLYRGVCTW